MVHSKLSSMVYSQLNLQSLQYTRLSSTTNITFIQDFPSDLCSSLDLMSTLSHPLPSFFSAGPIALGHLEQTALDI